MDTTPIVQLQDRIDVTNVVRLLSAIPRAVTWFVGAVLGSIVAGFVQGWRDAA